MDYIEIKNLVVFANHGVLQEENTLGQKFLVSVKLYHTTSHSGVRDDLSRGIDYSLVSNHIQHFLKKNTFKLIETCAEKLARHLLENFLPLHAVELTIKKPWAPIALPLDEISVTIHRSWHPVFIALGSNKGNRLQHLSDAIDDLSNSSCIRIRKISSFIETTPIGTNEGGNYLNGMLRIDTILLPRELLNLLHRIEEKHGRIRTSKFAPRPLDLDIIFYDNYTSEQPSLLLPHPRYRYRPFILELLSEIDPYFKDPESQETMLSIWQRMKNH